MRKTSSTRHPRKVAGLDASATAGLLTLCLITTLPSGSVYAQSPSETAESADADPEIRAEEVDGSAGSLFAGEVVLQAHKLRGLTAEVASLVLRGDTGGPIAFEALATPMRGGDGKAHIPVFIEIDGPSFLESNQSNTARVEVYAYALGASQNVAGYLAEVFAVNVQEIGEAVWQSGLKFHGHLDLPPGSYTLRAVVRNYHSKAATIRELALEVPSFGTPGPLVLLPLFPPLAGRDLWLPVRERAPADLAQPLIVDGRALSPAVLPVLALGRRVEAYLLASGVAGFDLRARIEWLRGTTPIESSPLEILGRDPVQSAGSELLKFAFEVPKLEPGRYELRIAETGKKSASFSASVPVALVQQSAGDHGLLWTDLRGRMTSSVQVAEKSIGPTGAGKLTKPEKKGRRAKKNREERKRVNAFSAAYRQALAALGSGQRSAARTAILDLEAQVLTDGSLESLQIAQLQVAQDLATTEVESLVPLLVLHDEVYLTYRRRNLFSLGANSRTFIERVAELYAEHGGTKGSRIVAARALASLGGRVQQANLPSSSRRLYRRALEHDPGSAAAALGLATSYERHGDYNQAVDVLEALVQAHPSHGEGLLRLAINLRRLGLLPRTRELLKRVVGSKAPDWVRSVASQELSRSLFVAGDVDEATELLEKSIEEIPDQQSAKYLLAHLYDRQRKPFDALELLSTVTPTRRLSARKIYDGWPKGPLDRVRSELLKAAEVRADLFSNLIPAAEAPEAR